MSAAVVIAVAVDELGGHSPGLGEEEGGVGSDRALPIAINKVADGAVQHGRGAVEGDTER